jgi:hypothetical protein
MAEFASKGVAGAGLGTGIAGLALGVLNSSNNGNGLLGGLLGGGNQNVVSALQAENSMLKAENLEDSWIPKEFTSATVTGTGFTDGHGKITFIPVQVVADKAISIDAMASYEVTFSGSVGGFGQTDHVVSLSGLCGDDQYVFLKSVNVICGVDNEGNGVMACLVPDATGKIKSNALKFRTINMDESSATKTRTFKVYITVTAEISNTNFSLGQLFPITK